MNFSVGQILNVFLQPFGYFYIYCVFVRLISKMGLQRLIWWAVAIAAIGVALSYFFRSEPLPNLYGGHVDPGFEPVERAFRENFEKGFEPAGAAFAVCHNGKMVVDLWGGYADVNALRPWKEETVSIAFSVTKGITSLCIAMLVDRGLLNYDDLVVKHWPEFGANGKANVTVKMLVGHEAGLAALDEPITREAVKDWRLMSKLFEKQTPNWPPGATAGYHMLTHGFLCDQLVRRIDPKRRSLGEFFKEEIAEPNDIDFYIGHPPDRYHRVARMIDKTTWDVIKRLDDWQFVSFIIKMLRIRFSRRGDELTKKLMRNPVWLKMWLPEYMAFNDPEVQAMELPSANGIGTARALAKLYCLLGDKKKPLLSKDLVDKISKPAIVTPEERIFGLNVTWGYGFMHGLNPKGNYQMGHPGHGGQNAKFDPAENLAFAYLRNSIAPESVGELVRTFRNLQQATYQSIGAKGRKNL